MTIRTPNDSYYVSGASGGQNHTLPFGADRFEDDDLFVYVWNTSTEAWDKKTVTTHYTVSSTQVSFTSGNIPSTRVIVLRKTDVDEDFPKADFVAGASIKAQDLDNNQMQALRGIKELRDQKLSAVPSIAEDGTPSNPKMHANLDMNGYKVINQPAGHVTSTDILDGTIATADLADSAITAAKLASDSVTTAKIASDAVNGTKIADDSINSEHYVDGSIDTAHIADAQITTAKIANDAVTADKLANTAVTAGSYTAADITVDAQGRVTAASSGTIGTSEIADDAVTTAKILDANVTTAKIADSAVTTAKIADAELVELATMGGNTASALADLTQSEVQILDGATVTTAELNILDGVTATATELNQLDGNTLKTSSTDFTSSSQFPSASEIDARITARIDPLGGFEAIADEDSFPATAPPAGTVISIANANGLAVNSSGVGAGTRAGGSDAVVINGFPSTFNSTSLDNGIGLLVIATSTAHTYDFHRVVAKNEDVRQLSSDINDFKARYRIGSSNPTTDNDAGDLFFNTGTSKMLVYNATSSAWEEVQAVGEFFINTLSSSSGTGGGSATFNGSAYRFTLSNAPTYAQQLLVSINGVVQKPNSGTSQPSEGFAIDGGDIILAAAPATGSNAFFITIGSSVGIGTPSDNTITNAKVTSDAAIAGTKISPDFGSQNVVTTGRLLLGTTTEGQSEADDLTIATSANTGMTIRSGTTSKGAVYFSDGTSGNSEYRGYVEYNHQDDHLRFGTAAAEKVRIDSSGRVGIGASNMSSYDASAQNLLVSDTSASSGITIRSGGGTPFGAIHFADGTSSNAEKRAGRIMYGHSGDFMLFSTADSEAMRINSSGNIGVGTTSPTAGNSGARFLHLHNSSSSGAAAAEIHFTNGTTGTGTGEGGLVTYYENKLYLWNYEANSLIFGTSNSERARFDSSGRLLLGTGTVGNAYADNLTIEDSSNCGITLRSSSTTRGSIYFADGTSGGEQYRGQIEYNHNGDYLQLYTAGASAMRIDSSGNVGIGTSSPTSGRQLTLSGNDSGLQISGSASGANSYITLTPGSSAAAYIGTTNSRNLNFVTNGATSSRMTIDSSGFITQKFTSNNSSTPEGLLINNENNATGNNASLIFSNDSGNRKKIAIAAVDVGNYGASDLVFALDGADSGSVSLSSDEKMRINSEGKVGIGTDSPGQHLTVKRTGGQTQVSLISDTTESGAIYFGDTASTNRGVVLYDHGQDSLQFYTAGSEKMRILSDGTIRLASGCPGIDFSQTQTNASGMSSETLDSYEEGTWTPSIGGGTGSLNSDSWGRYTKIGRRVHLNCFIKISSMDDTNTTFVIAGVPFTPVDPGSGGFVGSIMGNDYRWRRNGSTSDATMVTPYITDGTGGIRIYGQKSDAGWDSLKNVDWNTNEQAYIQISYDIN